MTHQRIGQGFYITTKIPISNHTVISGLPRMDSRVHKVLHNEILRVCEHKSRTGWVSLMAQVGSKQLINQSCWIVVVFWSSYRRAASTCRRIHSNQKRGGVSARIKRNHHKKVAKFLHMGGQFYQITITLKTFIHYRFSTGTHSYFLTRGTIHFQRQSDNDIKKCR